MNLTGEQRQAVRRLGQDVCVVAGPGSGKTRVLVERFRWRVEQGLSPLRILAVTFTEKAANELKQRLAREFRDLPELREQVERAQISTVHGFCARLLREHAIPAGIDPEFDVMEAGIASAELEAAAEEALDRLLEEQPEATRALLDAIDFHDPCGCLSQVYEVLRLTILDLQEAPALAAPDFNRAFGELSDAIRSVLPANPADWSEKQQNLLGRFKEWGRRVLELPASPLGLKHFDILGQFDCNLNWFKKNNRVYEEIKRIKQNLIPAARQALASEYYAPQRALLWEALERMARIYRERKALLRALDFADLEELAIGLLRDNRHLRERVRQSFDEVLMDELQDTNALQEMLVDLVVRPGRFFGVGDVNQSIYGFRHADPGVFRRYRDRVRAQGVVDRLRKNHRTRGEILAAVEAILGEAGGIERHELEPARPFAAKREPSVEVIAGWGATSDEAAALEAQWVAQRIRELAGSLRIQVKDSPETRPADFSDIAVLVRNVQALPPFERAFHEFGVPYLIARGKHFFEAQEVNDLVHWLRVLVNPRDEISMAAVLRSPLVGIGDETLLRLKELGPLGVALKRLDGEDVSPFDPNDLERLKWFRGLIAQMRAEADDVAPDRLLSRAIAASGYESNLSPRSRANVRKLLGIVREWFAATPRPLAELIRDLESLRASDPDEASAPPEDSSNAVRVMTIHGAKGLEFPVVFLAALHKGVNQSCPPVAFSPAAGLVARWRDPVSGEAIKDTQYAAFSEELSRKERDESDRLFYVAMTRAEEHLVLSFAATEKRGARNWAGEASAGLSLPVAPPRDVAFTHECVGRRGPFQVRVLYASKPPTETAARSAEPAAGEEELLPLPAATGQYDSTVSVTSVLQFAACPRRYYLARYLGWEAPRPALISEPRDAAAARSLDASEFGRQVHDLLAGLEVENAEAEALELARKFQASPLGRRIASAVRGGVEFDFLLAVDDVVIEGRIDVWFEEGRELVVVDYKTDEVDAADAVRHGQSYALQLRLYAIALQRLTGRVPDRAYVYMLRPQVAVPIELEPRQLDEALETVRALRDAQEHLDFPVRIGPQCRRCPYHRGLCPVQ